MDCAREGLLDFSFVKLKVPDRPVASYFGGSSHLHRTHTVFFCSIRQSRVAEVVDGAKLWSVSRLTAGVDESIFGHDWTQKPWRKSSKKVGR